MNPGRRRRTIALMKRARIVLSALVVVSWGSSTAAPPGANGGGAGGAAGAAGATGTSGSSGASGGGGAGILVPGDLGPAPASGVIDHSGPGGGVVGPVPSGALSDATWTASGCGDVPLAVGVTDAAWSSEVYDDAPSPYAVHASFRFESATSLSVVWETGPGTRASWLAIGESPTKLDRFVPGVSFTYGTKLLDKAMPLRVHEAHVCGLTPNRTYYFAVGGDGYYGQVYPVKTAPAKADEAPFRIGVFGDSNNLVYADFKVVVEKMRAQAPDFIAFTGDLVHDGAIQSQWDLWFAAAGDLFARAPIMAAHGNHEAMATAYFAQFAQPGNEEYYSFDYGNTHFVVLNDSPPMDSEIDLEAAFADQDFAAALARPTPPRWLVAMHHRPPYSSATSNLNVRAKLTPIYDKYHVDLVLNGHEHAYESTLPINGGKAVKDYAAGTLYITTGGAGGLLNLPTFTQESWSRKYLPAYNYVTVDVAGPKLTVSAFANDGSAIEAPIVLTK